MQLMFDFCSSYIMTAIKVLILSFGPHTILVFKDSRGTHHEQEIEIFCIYINISMNTWIIIIPILLTLYIHCCHLRMPLVFVLYFSLIYTHLYPARNASLFVFIYIFFIIIILVISCHYSMKFLWLVWRYHCSPQLTRNYSNDENLESKLNFGMTWKIQFKVIKHLSDKI